MISSLCAPLGMSSAGVCSHGHHDGAEPSHRGKRTLLSEEDTNVSYADWLHGHRYDGQFN